MNSPAVPPAVGTALTPTGYRVTRADLVRYAGASGDFNTIHWSDRAALAAGLPGVIAHGMLTMALATRFAGEWSGDPTSVVECSVRFQRPVMVPDDDDGVEVQLSGEVIDVIGDVAVVALSAQTADGPVLGGATAHVRFTSAMGG